MAAHFLTYLKQQHLAMLALFIALGGVSYAAVQLPANSVTTKQVKDFSLLQRDFKRGQLPRGAAGPTMGAVTGRALNPPPRPDRLWENLEVATPQSGSLFVVAHVESATLTCSGNEPCSVDLGLYVDDEPVEHTHRVLTSDCSSLPCRIRVSQQDLFGIATGTGRGSHRVQLCSRTRTGTITDFSEEGGEVGAILLGG